jgi:hypothetical protein
LSHSLGSLASCNSEVTSDLQLKPTGLERHPFLIYFTKLKSISFSDVRFSNVCKNVENIQFDFGEKWLKLFLEL